MGRKSIPQEILDDVVRAFRISASQATEHIFEIMDDFEIDCEEAVDFLFGMKALAPTRH